MGSYRGKSRFWRVDEPPGTSQLTDVCVWLVTWLCLICCEILPLTCPGSLSSLFFIIEKTIVFSKYIQCPSQPEWDGVSKAHLSQSHSISGTISQLELRLTEGLSSGIMVHIAPCLQSARIMDVGAVPWTFPAVKMVLAAHLLMLLAWMVCTWAQSSDWPV